MLSRPDAPAAFHVLAKPTGAVCNLDCEYCFYLSKEMLYPGSRFRMADDLLETYVRQLIEAHTAPEVVVAWQGGEPTLMGLDFFRRSVEYERQYARPGQVLINTIQTNGTLLDDEWGAFLAEHGFLVGISLDGPAHLHDAYRVDKGGKPTHDRVMGGLRTLQRHGVEHNALVTVNAANAEHALDVYRFLRDEAGFRFMQFIPIVERAHAGGDQVVTEHSVTGQQYGRFLVEVFDEWVHRDVGEVYVQMFDVALANWYGEPPGLCVHSETCGLALALEHTGDVYSCDHFVDPEHLLGNIRETHLLELVSSPQQQRFGADKHDLLPRFCRECDVRFACHGGCPKDRFERTPDGEPGLNYLCPGYKDFFHHIAEPMRVMSDLLRSGRAPAEIMRLPTTATQTTGPGRPR
ncbi:MAG: anaerobic sulfatase maturase [Actinomycetes bacterium]